MTSWHIRVYHRLKERNAREKANAEIYAAYASLAATKNPHPLHNISSDSYKSSSLLEKRIRLLSEELDKISSRAKKQDVQLLHILKIRKSQENKIDEYKILLSERNKTVEALSNELAVKTLELNKNLDREDLLKSENKLLLDRLLLEKSQLAKKVNDANEYLERYVLLIRFLC